jgi:hypothetical protein
MKRLSSGITWYRFGIPALYIIGAAVLINATPVLGPVIPFMLVGVVVYIVWYGWRLSEVWVDGDVLQVKGPRGSFRVSLSDVLLLDTGASFWMKRGQSMFVLGLDHPVGRVQKIRFIPADDGIERDLQARIHAARAARKL